MRWAENLAAIESEGRLLGQMARRDPDRSVPQYPDWTLADLASHTASIHGRTTLVCRELPSERVSAPRLPEGRSPIDWYEETLDGMLDALRHADPATPVWTFGGTAAMAFWERRMVVETGTHRWDASQAFGDPDPLTNRVATQGLEEFGDMWLPHLGDVQPLSIEVTDLDLALVYGSENPSETATGSASDIYLRLMSRPSPVVLPEDWQAAVDGLAPPPKR